MQVTYGDVASAAADLSLNLSCIAHGHRLDTDQKRFGAVADRLERLSRCDVETEPDEEDPLFTTVEGQVCVVFALYDQVGSKDRVAAKKVLVGLANKLKKVITNSGESPEEAEEVGEFFNKLSDIAWEVSVTGLRCDPVFEIFDALTEGANATK